MKVINKLPLAVAIATGISAAPSLVLAQSLNLLEEVVVTARRVEESAQDVPISMTVYQQQQLDNRNIVVASDLAAYTPSLSVNTRYGPEKTSFSLRGFNQDQSTAPTVGVYFADVVGVRAQGGTTSGNTVGAGTFTDLQNVQVLKGVQGTLFGRNTTGGAILLVPTKPTDKFGGYIEGSTGDYDMRRVQGAINIPMSDTFRIRASFDDNDREGYMRNRSGIGPKDYNDVNYSYARLSAVWDITPELENYTIVHYSNSDTNGYAGRLVLCDRNPAFPPDPAFSFTKLNTTLSACDQIDRQEARGDSLYDVEVNNRDSYLELKQWQFINTTTFVASENLTVKNTVSYGEFSESARFSLNSDNFVVSPAMALFGLTPGTPYQHILLDVMPGADNSAQSTITEELQFQGTSFDDRFTWVIGGYLEFSDPDGWNSGRTSIFANCDSPSQLDCDASALGFGLISQSRTKLEFENHGIFAQGTYDITNKFALTVGARMTFDEIRGESEGTRYTFAPIPGVGTIPVSQTCNDSLNHPGVDVLASGDLSLCNTKITNKSEEATWLLGLDYRLSDDTLLWSKYSRGYRQGGINFTNPGLETWEPESVDSYEIGLKTAFEGDVHGFFNISAFYNEFTDQQVFGALIAKPTSGLAGGAGIINAGESEIKGIEIDASATFFRSLRFDLGYTYLDTEIKELTPPTLSPDSPFSAIIPTAEKGSPLTLTPENKLSLTATYLVPMDESLGNLSVGATYTYAEEHVANGSVPAEVGVIPDVDLVNLNVNWNNAMGSPVDVALFVTNVTDEEYPTNTSGGFVSGGYDAIYMGPPRMWGARLRYNFGE